MSLHEVELIHALLWMLFILLLFVILHVVQQLDQLQVGNSRQETHHPAEHHYPYAGLSVPVEETQEPGIHPSMAWKNRIKVLRNELSFNGYLTLMEGRGLRNRVRGVLPCEENQETRDAMENEERDKKMKAGDQKNPLHTVSNDVASKNTELNKDEFANEQENGEQPGCVPDEPQNEDNTVSDTLTPSGAMAVEAASDEQPSASGFSAIAHATSPNPDKEKRGKKNKRKKKKKAMTDERRDKEMPVSDPEASTDESHHSSIETFNSGFEPEEIKSNQSHDRSHRMEAMSGGGAYPKEKRVDK